MRRSLIRRDDLQWDRGRFFCTLGLGLVLFFVFGSRQVVALSIALPIDEIILKSKLAVRARVVAVESAWDVGGTRIGTTNTLEIIYPVKGLPPGKRLTVFTEGGTVGDVTMIVEDEVAFVPGEAVVVFLEVDTGTLYRVYAHGQGKFEVVGDRIRNRFLGIDQPAREFFDHVERALTREYIPSTLPLLAERNRLEAEEASQVVLTAPPVATGEPVSSGMGLSRQDFLYSGQKWPGPNPMGELYYVNVNSNDLGLIYGDASFPNGYHPGWPHLEPSSECSFRFCLRRHNVTAHYGLRQR